MKQHKSAEIFDDTVLLAYSEEKLQNLIGIVVKKSNEFGMHLNEKKTETMITTTKKNRDSSLYFISEWIDSEAIKEIQISRHNGKLGCMGKNRTKQKNC